VTTRTDVYLSAVVAVLLLVVGLSVLTTSVITTTEVGTVIVTGTVTTVIGAAASLVTGYRAARHYANVIANRAAAALVRDIIAHDARLASVPPDATVVKLAEAQARRQPRESTT
jgi:hypothetical protein